MTAYFLSDVHLRLDHPERGRRLARLVDQLGPDDPLTIVGDLCDFWYASRQRGTDPNACEGLRALAAFRARGGAIAILPGNHDLWLGPFYETTIGARFVSEPMRLDVHGLRLHLVHGHLLGARRAWKSFMESRSFLEAFQALPAPAAETFDRMLEHSNSRKLNDSDQRHLAAYRRYADSIRGQADLIVIGHVHTPSDAPVAGSRMVVLGGWHHRSSYLKIDETGATLVVEDDPDDVETGRAPVVRERLASTGDRGGP